MAATAFPTRFTPRRAPRRKRRAPSTTKKPPSAKKRAAKKPVAAKPSRTPRPSPLEPRVWIDDRAGSGRSDNPNKPPLIAYPPLDSCAELCRLDSADALILGVDDTGAPTRLIGVEVKSLSDLLSSLDTGRLQAAQIPAMLAAYDESWLAVYGRWRAAPDGGGGLEALDGRSGAWRAVRLGSRAIPYGFVEKRFLAIAAVGVAVRTFDTLAAVAAWIGELASWSAKRTAAHKTFHTFNRAGAPMGGGLIQMLDPAVKLRAEMLSRLPGVGFERAVAAAQHFPSVAAAVNATEEEWMEVEGIGAVIARAICESVR